jgi:predicted nucleic acid-binding protein
MLVLDSSVILAWVLDDEDHLGPDLLRRLTTTEVAKVPCHWILEVTNGLQMAVKRRRLAADDPPKLLARIVKKPIQVDAQTPIRGWSEIPALAQAHGLTTYDAAYLELAMRIDAPLATLDQDLARAARQAGVTLFS